MIKNKNTTTNKEAGIYIFKDTDDFLKCMDKLQEQYNKKAGFNYERNTI